MKVIVDKTYNVRESFEVPDSMPLSEAKEKVMAFADSRDHELTDKGADLELESATFYRQVYENEEVDPNQVLELGQPQKNDERFIEWFDVDH